MTYEAFREQFHIRLNDQQEKAVRAVEGAVLLLAVPGSGKTTVLVTRLGYMIHGCGILPENILTMTYTVAATRDMRGRFAALFGEELAARLEFRTINGVSARVIRYYEKTMGRRAFELISDEKELAALTSDIYHRVTGEYPTESDIKGLRTAITYAKNQMLSQEEIREMDKELKGFSLMYRSYDQALKERGCMDYDDQMVYAWQILRKYPEILEAFQRRYRYLCVDEAQDTSKIQHEIIRLLAGDSGNLFMVGDEDQSIYGFRAAWPQALLGFEKVHPCAQVLLMERNYRSTDQIVAAAGRFIRQNGDRREKQMTAVRGEGFPLREIQLNERKNQYGYLLQVAKDCRRETAVLYRDNDCALPLMDLLEREGIPYRCRLMDGNFFSHRVTRDLTDIMRLALDPADGETFLRVYYKFGAGISKAAAEAAVRRSDGRPIFDVLREDSSLSDWTEKKCAALQSHLYGMVKERGDKAVYRILHFMGYGEYLQLRGMDMNRAHILEALGEREPTPVRLLERLEELRDIIGGKTAEPESNFVLSTIHSSKGLEYERVILMDVIDSILPKKGEDVSLEEERRLFYVGMTRARDELMIFTFRKPGYGSEFARYVFPKDTGKTAAAKPKSDVRQGNIAAYQKTKVTRVVGNLADFAVGRSVVHRQFGPGTIAARQGELLTIAFDDGQSKKLSLPVALQAKVLRLVAKE